MSIFPERKLKKVYLHEIQGICAYCFVKDMRHDALSLLLVCHAVMQRMARMNGKSRET